MRAKLAVALALTIALATACNPESDNGDQSEAEGEGAGGQESTVVGLTVSHTGNLTAESTNQFNGLTLWAEQVNDDGGISVGNDNVTVELVEYDDESTDTRVQQLYTRLITEDEADFLISPYSSGLTEAAATVAEQNETVMLAVGAASDS